MSFKLREMSWWLGKPVGYFRFVRGGVTWAYTTADRQRVLSGLSYDPAVIKRSAIKVGAERRKLNITVTAQRDLPVMANWHPYPPRDPVILTIMQQHDGDSEIAVDWVGRVTGAKFSGTQAQLICEPTMAAARGASLNRCWQYGCPHAVYSRGHGLCNVSKAAFAVAATVTQVDAVTFTAAAFAALPEARLAGGFIEYPRVSDGVMEYRTIMAHAGNKITLDAPLYDVATPIALTAYPGCRGTWEDCNDYFHNGDNYGGDLNIPQRSATDGNPIW